jgi:hypothetical protein
MEFFFLYFFRNIHGVGKIMKTLRNEEWNLFVLATWKELRMTSCSVVSVLQ